MCSSSPARSARRRSSSTPSRRSWPSAPPSSRDCATVPRVLVHIDERLTSRFDAGLTVAIEPPELEMRVAILMRKAELEATVMPEDVAFFVAKNVRANVRELEGALRKILAYA